MQLALDRVVFCRVLTFRFLSGLVWFVRLVRFARFARFAFLVMLLACTVVFGANCFYLCTRLCLCCCCFCLCTCFGRALGQCFWWRLWWCFETGALAISAGALCFCFGCGLAGHRFWRGLQQCRLLLWGLGSNSCMARLTMYPLVTVIICRIRWIRNKRSIILWVKLTTPCKSETSLRANVVAHGCTGLHVRFWTWHV